MVGAPPRPEEFVGRTFCAVFLMIASCLLICSCAPADAGLQRVNHIVIVMQENHSFDNYFGVLAYAPGSSYHNGTCAQTDHRCVDGLTCTMSGGVFSCTNSNVDDDGATVYAFKAASPCSDDLDHSWPGTHTEIDFGDPNQALANPLSDGFVRQNDLLRETDSDEAATDDQTMSFYDQDDLPFYYDLAEKFAISDRQFASAFGPTFPNRSYLMAATSFGHVGSGDALPSGGYKPISETIFELMDRHGISWADYSEDGPQDGMFRPADSVHELPFATFLQQAAGSGELPQVSFVDPAFSTAGNMLEDDEHPPSDIRQGQYHVSQVVNAVRNGPFWRDSIIFILYDEHGGFYDHVKPPEAPQNGERTPDGIYPGQCEDLSSPPSSEQPGAGADCSSNWSTTLADVEALCPELASNPTGPFPANCAAFDQLGVRIPLIAVSPFSKSSYVSHLTGDHTSLLALIEKRFMRGAHLTRRDQYANDLEDLFDFDTAPSLNTQVGTAQAPQENCTAGR